MSSYFDLTKPAPKISYLPYILFGGETGLWHDVKSTPDSNGGWLTHKQELLAGFVLCLDFGSILKGPIEFSTPPKFQYLRPFDQQELEIADLSLPAGHKFRPGMQVRVIMKGCNELREFSSNSGSVCLEIRRLWDAFAKSPEAMAGKLPCYRVLPSRSYFSKTQGKTFYAPVVELLGWVDRHPAFGERTVPLPQLINPPQIDIDRIHQERLGRDTHSNAAPATLRKPAVEPEVQTPPPTPQFDPDLNDFLPF